MATQIMLTRKAGVAAFLFLALTGCANVVSISGEEPYSAMVGECYILQQDMRIRENICWEIGDLILSPDEGKDCLRSTMNNVEKGTEINVLDIRRKRWGSAGFCPQIVVAVEEMVLSNREINIPLCLSVRSFSWLEDPIWQRGDAIRLKKEYVLPCGN